jgi:hypothetical protein
MPKFDYGSRRHQPENGRKVKGRKAEGKEEGRRKEKTGAKIDGCEGKSMGNVGTHKQTAGFVFGRGEAILELAKEMGERR